MLLPLQLMIMKKSVRIALPCSRKKCKMHTKREGARVQLIPKTSWGVFFFCFFLGGGGVTAEVKWRQRPRFDFSITNISKAVDRTKASNLLRIPFLHGPACHASIVFQGSLLWNSLPAEARSKRTIQTFKNYLRNTSPDPIIS